MTELGAWEFRATPRTVYLSPELCALLNLHGQAGWLMAEVLSRWKRVDRPALAAALQDAVRGGRRLEFEGRLVGRTDPEAWLRLVGEPVFERGECVGLQGDAQLAIGARR